MGNPIVKVICGALVAHKNKILVVQEQKEYVRGKWSIPAGHLEVNESIVEGAIREVKEETGIDIKITGVLGIYESRGFTGNNVIRIIFVAEPIDVILDKSIIDVENVEWMKVDGFLNLPLEKIRNEVVVQIVKDYKSGQMYNLSILKNIGF